MKLRPYLPVPHGHPRGPASGDPSAAPLGAVAVEAWTPPDADRNSDEKRTFQQAVPYEGKPTKAKWSECPRFRAVRTAGLGRGET